MNARAQPSEPVSLLPVDDPRRRAVARAAFGTLLAAGAFFVFTVPTKQFAPLYDHAPWRDDPFDTVYSFAMFFVPLVAAGFLVQVSLCRKSEPLAIDRVLSILRACNIAIAVIVITLLSCWISVATEANRSHWAGGATVVLVASLCLVTALTGKVIVYLLRAPRLPAPEREETALSIDWLGDAISVAERESGWLGPLRPTALDVVRWFDRNLVIRMRRHPLVGATFASLAFGLMVGVNQGIREGYVASATLLTIGLLTCGMFAFLVAAGSYLGVVRSSTPLYGIRRRAVDACVVASIAAVVSLAFRNSLWWVVGSNQSAAGTAQFATLLGAAVLVAFMVVFGAESILRSHSRMT